MSEKVFVAHVTLSWGEKRDYLIANDVEPGLQHRLDTYGDSWNEVMQNALMNVPVAPYLPSNSVQPPIATAKVSDVEARDFGPTEEKLQRTRSQFIMAAMWKNSLLRPLPTFCTTTTTKPAKPKFLLMSTIGSTVPSILMSGPIPSS